MPEARVGKIVHSVLEHVLGGSVPEDAMAELRGELEDEREQARFDALGAGVRAFARRMESFRRRRRLHRAFIEHPLAVRADLSVTGFHAGDAFYRGIIDAAFWFDDDVLAVIDHKTGVRAGRYTILDQLQGYAVLSAAAYRQVHQVWLGIHWVADASVEWAEPVRVVEIRDSFVPALLDNVEAAALAVDDGPRPHPGGWCERCNYRSICPAAHALRFEPVEDDEPEPWA